MKLSVHTSFPVAYDSNDHIDPKGTKHDNTRKIAFVERTEQLFVDQKIVFADLGCAGGGLVKDFVDRGHSAVGIEGSDYSKVNQRAEWATIPDNLFTADISKPFFITTEENITCCCDLITSWDVLEHIEERKMYGLLSNIYNNLKTNGLFVCSIATFPDGPHHVTLRPKEWWVKIFKEFNLNEVEDVYNTEQRLRESSFFLNVVKG